MIEVIKSKKKIEIKGHARFAPKGHDIVCAAATSLVNATLNSLKGFKRSEIKIKGEDVIIDIKHQIDQEDQIRLDMLMTGLRLIAIKYPKYLTIKEK